MIISIRIDKSVQTIHLWQLPWHMSMYHSKVVYVFQNGISSWEQLTMTAPGQLCYVHASVYPPIQFPHLRIHDPGLSYYTVILLTGHERFHSILTMNFMQDYWITGGLIDFWNVCCNLPQISSNCQLLCAGQFDLWLLDIQKNAVFFPGGGGTYKHLFDRDARLRSNVKYPRK